MRKLLEVGKIVHGKGKVPLLKRYLDEMHGKPLQDTWTDISLSCQKNKRFPTQKPEALLERIILTSSNAQQIVYEPFAGSATAGVVCHKLSRRWIGSELSIKACQHALNRLEETGCNAKLIQSIDNFSNLTANQEESKVIASYP